MAHHPVLWPKKTFFYPIGNTVPTLLTSELSPGNEAKVLLLGCGDPRSILYTVYADLGDRKFDFTCCDWEPAILARNALLLTLLADGATPIHAWAIFYHFFLEKPAYDTLMQQCRLLDQLSENIHTWNQSKYGGYIRFCTDESLQAIRRHWKYYLETESISAENKKAQKKAFQDGMRAVRASQKGLVINSFRSAGPLFQLVAEAGSASFQKYWTTGVTTSRSFRSSEPYPHVNPTFVYSRAGERFNVHYGTDPILAFPLAPALAYLKDDSLSLTIQSEDLVDVAMKFFFLWGTAFKKRVSQGPSGGVVVRLVVSECLALCQALHGCNEAQNTNVGVYTGPWSGSQIRLSDGAYTFSPAPSAPLSFNVIDTSNLTDHVGLLNLLIAVVPLLEQKPWSTIRTNSLLQSASTIADQLCADIPTLSIFLGIAPSSNLFHFTTHSNKHEILASSETSHQFHQQIIWKVTQSAFASPSTSNFDTRLSLLLCDERKLANMLFSVYLRMFADENVADLFRNMDLNTVVNRSDIHYSRASFAALLALIKRRVASNWIQVMRFFIDLVESDRTLMMGPNNYQDLIYQLYLQNVYTIGTLHPNFIEQRRSNRDRFHGWSDVPPVICIVLKVPRSKLRVLEDIDPDKARTPILQCESRGPTFHNIHSSIRPIFGDIRVSSAGPETQVTLEEDAKGWDGNSPLIVTFYMPSWILTHSPLSTTIGLYIRSTPLDTSFFQSKLGAMLAIYSTSLADKEHVHVVRQRPDNPEMDRLLGIPVLPASFTDFSPVKQVFVALDGSGKRATSITVRQSVTDAEATRNLGDGAVVSAHPSTDVGILVSFTGYERLFVYPFPIRSAQCKTRIARKSRYIEVEAPVRPDFEDFLDLPINPFPIFSADGIINILGVHYLNLKTSPALRISVAQGKLLWLPVHLRTMFSRREGEARDNWDFQDRGPFLNLKQTIYSLITAFAGLDSRDQRVDTFRLVSPTHGLYALIFVNDIRLDLPSHTIVADACVLPITSRLEENMESLLAVISSRGSMEIITLDDEMRLWMQFIPVAAERCRTWTHTLSCEYHTTQSAFPSKGPKDSPLCSCGKGQDLGTFTDISELGFVCSEATRIAISPLFSFSTTISARSGTRDDRGQAQSDGQAPSTESSTSRCANCGGPGLSKLLTCGGCKDVQYCSRTCQKSHWKAHKGKCSKTSPRS